MDLSVGAGQERPGMEKASILIEILRKLTDLSVGAGQQRPGMDQASILITIL